MLSGAKPAAVSLSRKGSRRSFQVGTLRPCLSLPNPVSTTIRRDGVSTTSEWIDIFSRPSPVAKCGISHGSFWISSLLANGRMKRVLPTVSSSTTLVILTRPTFQLIRRFPKSAVVGVKDAGFRAPVQWIIWRAGALRGMQNEGCGNARTSDFGGKGRVFDRKD